LPRKLSDLGYIALPRSAGVAIEQIGNYGYMCSRLNQVPAARARMHAAVLDGAKAAGVDALRAQIFAGLHRPGSFLMPAGAQSSGHRGNPQPQARNETSASAPIRPQPRAAHTEDLLQPF
jgi:hypothetical protein